MEAQPGRRASAARRALAARRQWRWWSMEVATKRLLAPAGLRSLTPGHPDYKARYDGDLRSRDAAYHQGTVWAWLIDPSVEAWFKLHPDRPAEARQFLAGLAAHFEEACSGSISEVFDAGPPYCRAVALSRPGAWPRCCAVGSRRRARETTRSIEQAWPLTAIQRSNKIKLGSMTRGIMRQGVSLCRLTLWSSLQGGRSRSGTHPRQHMPVRTYASPFGNSRIRSSPIFCSLP